MEKPYQFAPISACVVKLLAGNIEIYKNLKTLQASVFRILQYFVTKLNNLNSFKMPFLAVLLFRSFFPRARFTSLYEKWSFDRNAKYYDSKSTGEKYNSCHAGNST